MIGPLLVAANTAMLAMNLAVGNATFALISAVGLLFALIVTANGRV